MQKDMKMATAKGKKQVQEMTPTMKKMMNENMTPDMKKMMAEMAKKK